MGSKKIMGKNKFQEEENSSLATNLILLKTILGTKIGQNKFCSAWLRLKLNTKMGFKHPPPPPPGTFSKGFRLSKVLRFGM